MIGFYRYFSRVSVGLVVAFALVSCVAQLPALDVEFPDSYIYNDGKGMAADTLSQSQDWWLMYNDSDC